ncbi:extracellular solute-binding protein, partial [Patulibacter sp. S7RM1-6]
GREFAPWARALRRQAAASPDPVTLDDAWLPLPDLHERLLGQDAARDGGVDLILVPTDWLAELIDDGHLLPLAGGRPDDWEDAWTPSLRGLQTADGEAYGLPYHDGPTLLLYRTDLVEGPPPTTWAGVLDAARAHTDPAAGRYGTVLAGRPDGHNDVYDFVALLDAHGGRLLDDAGRPAFDDAAGAAALTFLHDLWHVHRVVAPAARDWDSVASGERFAAGEGALMVNWAGYAAMSADPASPTHGRVACAPPPG